MKKVFYAIWPAVPALILCLLLQACVKDSGMRTVKVYTPVYKTSGEVRAAIKSDAPQPVVTPGKLVILGDYIFLNEVNRGVHIIDNSNPSSPVNKAFIHIPGNGDIAVQGNTLYADCFTDLMAVDISDPLRVKLKAHIDGLFPERAYVLGYHVPEGKVIVDFKASDKVSDVKVGEGQGIWKDGSYYTRSPYYDNGGIYYDMGIAPFTIASSGTSQNKSNATGTNGSASRFAILDRYLYAVSAASLKTVDIAGNETLRLAGTESLATSGETIYPFGDKLFIGGATGIQIFELANPERPAPKGFFGHFCSGDPVIVDNDVAYITLHSSNLCAGVLNELDVVDVHNVLQTRLIRTYPLESPYGLSKDGNYLFICDGGALKIFNAGDPAAIKLITAIPMDHPFDVICYRHIAIVSAADGLYQFDYSDIGHVKLLSKIGLTKAS